MVGRVAGKAKSKGRHSNFVYHKRSADQVKARAEQSGGRFDSPFKNGVDTFRPKQGDNLVRILPATWEDHDHYGFDAWVHAYVGMDNSTYLCLAKMKSKSCPICVAAKESSDAGEADEAKALQPVKKVLTWVIDRDEDSPTPKLWAMSWTQDRDIAALCHNKRSGNVFLIDHPDEGFDVSLKRTGQGLKTRYIGLAIDREASAISEDPDEQEKILEYINEHPLPSVLKYHDTDYLDRVMAGTAEQKDADLDEDEEQDDGDDDDKPKRKKAKRQDDEDDEQDEEQEEERPKRKPLRVAAVEEEDDEDEPIKRKANGKHKVKAKHKDEDEEDEDAGDNEDDEEAVADDEPDEEDSEPEEDEEDEPPKRKTSKPERVKHRARDDDEGDDEDEAPPRRKVVARRR